MFRFITNTIDYFNLRDVGLLELVFALTPVLTGFNLGPLPLSVLMWVFLIFMVFLRYGKFNMKNFKPLTIFVIYWVIHQLVLLTITDVNTNTLIAQIVYFATVFCLYPSLDARKLRGSMNWVAIISIAGLLFQWLSILGGNGVHPLEIPGLTMSESRLEQITFRPSSFYMEPAAYVAFMICPLTLALIDRKYLWATIIIFSILLSTSTTGIILSIIILIVSLFSNKVRFSSLLIVGVLCFGVVYAITNLEIFEVGLEKLENTDASVNVRLSQGPRVVATMHPEEYIFGAPYSSAYTYCMSGRMTDVLIYGESVYMSTFWDMILCYGIVGLVLYLLIYVKLFKMSRLIWPLLVALCATLFSDPDGIKSDFIYKLIFMLVIATSGSELLTNKSRHKHVTNHKL